MNNTPLTKNTKPIALTIKKLEGCMVTFFCPLLSNIEKLLTFLGSIATINPKSEKNVATTPRTTCTNELLSIASSYGNYLQFAIGIFQESPGSIPVSMLTVLGTKTSEELRLH